MKKLIVMMLLASGSLFASSAGGEHGGTDIVPRTLNFLIFAGILWYLLAKPVRAFFVGRSEEIASRLNSVQDKLRESKEKKEAAEAAVEDAARFADELHATTEREKDILRHQIETQCANDAVVMEKQLEGKEILAKRQMVRDVVEATLADVTAQSGAALERSRIAEIISKKVA